MAETSPITRDRNALARRVAPAATGAVAFLAVAALYMAGDRALYMRIIEAWGVRPALFPFFDTSAVLSWLRCFRLGVDVFATNPCDPLGRLFNYSPLWLAASVLPVTTAWTEPVGLTVVLGFLLSMLLLPPGRSLREVAVIVAGTLSTAVVFAAERANADLVIFALAAPAAALACRDRTELRLAGYGLAFLAGLLKFYPMTLMTLATRERPKLFLLVALVSVAVLVAFVAIEQRDLARALALIPAGSYFGDMIGAKMLPAGLAQAAQLPDSVGLYAELALVVSALALGGRIGSGATLHADLAALTGASYFHFT